MKIEVYFNTDGYIGAWAMRNNLGPPSKLTKKEIKRLKENNLPAIVEIPTQDMALLHNAINCRDGVEVVGSESKNFDTQFGNMKLKFNQAQRQQDIKKTKDAHKLNKTKSKLEKSLYL